MSWIDTLDRLISDSWIASRQESAALLDNLLALPLGQRWILFATRDPRLMLLSEADYAVLFDSLNTHAVMAHIADIHNGLAPGFEGAGAGSLFGSPSPGSAPLGSAPLGSAPFGSSSPGSAPLDPAAPAVGPLGFAPRPSVSHGWTSRTGLTSAGTTPATPPTASDPATLAPSTLAWRRKRAAIRAATLATIGATALMAVGAAVTLAVTTLLPAPATAPVSLAPPTSLAAAQQPTPSPAASADGAGPIAAQTALLASRLGVVERETAQLAKRVVLIDNQFGEANTALKDRFGVAVNLVRLTWLFDQLEAAAGRGPPFGEALGRVAAALPRTPAFAALLNSVEPYARSGVPSLLGLRDRFDEMAPRLIVVVDGDDRFTPRWAPALENQGLFSGLLLWVDTVFGWAETADSRHFRAVLAGIRASIGLGDLAGAVRQVEALHAYPAGAIAGWLVQAHAHLAAQHAVADLRQAALATMTALTDHNP